MHIIPLTHAEEQYMQLFWRLQSFYLKEVMQELSEPKPHQNTVSTYLKILVEKEFLKTEKEGRIFRYTVAVPFEQYRLFVFRRMIENFFSGSPDEVLKMLEMEKMQNRNVNFLISEEEPRQPIKNMNQEHRDSVAELVHELTHPKKGKKKKKKEKKKK